MRNKRVLLVIFSIGLLISLLLSGLMFRYELDVAEERFFSQTNKIIENIKESLRHIKVVDDKLSFLFQVSDNVSDEDFLLHGRAVFSQMPYVEKVIYAPQIKNTHRIIEEKKLRHEGYTGFKFQSFFYPESATSLFPESIFPVKFIQPFTPYTSIWFGRDLMTYKPINNVLKDIILNNKKLQAATIVSEKETIFYLFSTVTFIESVEKVKERPVKTENIFGLLGYKINLKNWLQPKMGNPHISTSVTLNKLQLISQGVFEKNVFVDIKQTESINFNGQIIKLKFQLNKPFELVDYRIPLLVFISGLLLTGLFFFIEKNHLERNKLLSEQNLIVEKKVAEKTALLKEQSIELKAAYTHQLAVTHELESFSYSISHDLRAPLRSISGFARALNEDYGQILDGDAKNMLERVQKNAQRMSLLIDDLLSLAKVSRQAFKREEFSISELVNEQVKEFLERQFSRVDITVTQSLQTQGDFRLIRVALNNLLSNAIKYSAKAKNPSIEFGITRINSMNTYFIKDNGVGFDMAYAGKLFTPFQRLHGAEFEGTGIGLAIVQRIINRHGGKIWAESTPEKGTTFYFTLT